MRSLTLQPPSPGGPPAVPGTNPLSAGCAGTARPLVGILWANVPSVLWYFRGHGRTIPDLELLLIAAPSSTQEPTHLMLPLHLAPDMQTGVARASGPVLVDLWPPGPGPCQSKRDGAPMGGLPAWQPLGRPSLADLSAVDLGWARGPSCTYPPGLPFLDAPSSPPWADLSTRTCDPLFLLHLACRFLFLSGLEPLEYISCPSFTSTRSQPILSSTLPSPSSSTSMRR